MQILEHHNPKGREQAFYGRHSQFLQAPNRLNAEYGKDNSVLSASKYLMTNVVAGATSNCVPKNSVALFLSSNDQHMHQLQLTL
jgi:hypothetical protein